MTSQHSTLTILCIAAAALGFVGGPARAAGGYAGIDGGSSGVPTPQYHMFSGQPPYSYSVPPPVSTYNRFGVRPHARRLPSHPLKGQPHR